jgi:hypothetical protein
MIVKIKVGIRRRSRFSYKFRANWNIFSILRMYFRGGRMSLRMRSVPSKYNKKRTYASKTQIICKKDRLIYLNTLAIPLQYRYHSVITSKGYAWDKHGMVTEKIGITKIEESYK